MEIYDPEDNATIFPFDFPPKVEPSHGSFIDAGQGKYITPRTLITMVRYHRCHSKRCKPSEDFNVTFQINPVADNPTAETMILSLK